jgi:hypothetical protein
VDAAEIEAWETLTVCTREGGPHVTHLAIRRAVRHTSRLTRLLLTLSLYFAASLTLAAVVGDQAGLKAMQRSGVPVHHAPGGTQGLQRLPGGTVATVIGTARAGRWLQTHLPDHRTEWISARYVGWTLTASPQCHGAGGTVVDLGRGGTGGL